jgi:hypothetical protein
MLWYFARQLDSNINYKSDISAQAEISGFVVNFDLNLYAISTTNLIATSKTTDLGIGVLSLSYAITSLAWHHKDASATTSWPFAADYACDGTASDTVLPICLNDMV